MALRIGMGFAALVWIFSPYATSAQQDQANQTCLQSDYEILKKFYESTGGGVTWDKQKSWNMNLSPSQVNSNTIGSFEGILLSFGGGGLYCPSTCVDELSFWAGYFPGEEMTGTLPPEMGDFCGLTYLDLSDQELTGPIPATLGDNADLLVVDLSSNRLTGTIPPSLLEHSNLEELYLQANYITGTIPPNQKFGLEMTILFIEENEMEGELPESVADSNLDPYYSRSSLVAASEAPSKVGRATGTLKRGS